MPPESDDGASTIMVGGQEIEIDITLEEIENELSGFADGTNSGTGSAERLRDIEYESSFTVNSTLSSAPDGGTGNYATAGDESKVVGTVCDECITATIEAIGVHFFAPREVAEEAFERCAIMEPSAEWKKNKIIAKARKRAREIHEGL